MLKEGEHGSIHLPVPTFPMLELARKHESKGEEGRVLILSSVSVEHESGTQDAVLA